MPRNTRAAAVQNLPAFGLMVGVETPLDDDVDALLDLLSFIGDTADLEVLFQGFAVRLARAIRLDRCTLALLDVHGEGYDLRTLAEERPGVAPGHVDRVAPERGLFGEVLASGQPFLLLDVSARADRDRCRADPGMGPGELDSVLVVGMRTRERLLGTLAIGAIGRKFDERDVHLARIVGAQLSLAVDRLRDKDAVARSRDYYLTLFEEFPALIWRSRTDGKCDYFNKTWLAFTGRTRELEWGDGWTEGIHPDDRPDVMNGYLTSFEARRPFFLEYRLRRHDGAYRWIYDFGRPFYGLDRQFAGYIGSCYDATERKVLEDQLRSRQQEAQEQALVARASSRLKTEFLTNMSHELRTPLNSIIGFSELLHDGKIGPMNAEQHEFLGDVLDSARHLLQLINDVLDIARIEAGRMTFHPEPIELASVISEVNDTLRALAWEKQINVALTIAPSLSSSSVVNDKARLKQVLYNYLSNAIKFTPNGGRVVVRALPEGDDRFRLEVEDTGIGIRTEDLPRLFFEFQQLDTDAAQKYPGTGLGLALTKQIVEAQGGEVGVRSTLGKGTLFFAVLPRRATRSVPPPRAQPLRAISPGERVLIVEHDPAGRDEIAAMLARGGYAVTSAGTGEHALALCRERTFGALVLDLVLPDMSGWEVLRGIRSAGKNGDTPVIVVTVVAERGITPVHLNDYLTRPVTQSQLVGALRRSGLGGGGGSVLVVADDPGTSKVIAPTLEALGYQPVCCRDGESGLRAAEEQNPVAVILDLSMPGMSGFEFLERFSNTAVGKSTPVIAWTAKEVSAADRMRISTRAHAAVQKRPDGAAELLAELSRLAPLAGVAPPQPEPRPDVQ